MSFFWHLVLPVTIHKGLIEDSDAGTANSNKIINKNTFYNLIDDYIDILFIVYFYILSALMHYNLNYIDLLILEFLLDIFVERSTTLVMILLC